MKKIFLIVSLLVSFISLAQNDTTKYYKNNDYGFIWNRGKFNKGLIVPNDTTIYKRGVASVSNGFYVGDGVRWYSVAGVTIDTSSISTRIDARVKYSDTSAMLTPYVRGAGLGLTKTSQHLLVDTASASIISRQRAAATYVPYTGATTNVNLGSNSLTATGITNSSMTSGSVLFAGASGVMSQDNSNFFWDNTNKRLGIGTTTPAARLTLFGANATNLIQLTPTSNSSDFGGLQLNVADGTERAFFKLNPSTGEVRIGATGSGYFPTFYAQGVEAMRINPSTRNVAIGTTTDAGYKLDVNGTARVSGATQLGNITSNAGLVNTIGHNGTNASSNDGTATIRFASQFSNYPFTMGAEGNGYNFWIRQNNGGQGLLGFDFGTLSSILYRKSFVYNSTFYSDIYLGKWVLDAGGGANGSTGNNFTIRNNVNSNSTSVIYDGVNIDKSFAVYPTTNDPLISFFNGTSTTPATGINRYVARINRLGYLGIGTTNTYATPTTAQQASITINQGTYTGLKTSDGTTPLQVKTTGSNTIVTCIGNGNSELAMGLIVGSKITANGETRTIVSIANAQQCIVDAAVNWDNGGAGYNFTFTNPYMSLQNGSSKYFYVGSIGDVGIGTNTPNASAALDITSTTKGFLPPRLTTTQRDAISSPATGLMVYDTTVNKVSVYNGTTWKYLLYE